MKSALRKWGLAGSLVLFAVSVFATNSPVQIPPSITNLIDPEIIQETPQVRKLMEDMSKAGLTTDKAGNLLDAHFLLASLVWGSVGVGYLLYARRQRMVMPFMAGVAMIGVSYFVGSWLWMSIICIGLMIAVYQLAKQGY